jgi:hypothetical protein
MQQIAEEVERKAYMLKLDAQSFALSAAITLL